MTQAFNLAQLANNLNSSGQLDATDGLYGVLPVANGGTGQSTLTSKSVLVGNGTSGVAGVAPGTSGNVLVSNGTDWTAGAISTSTIPNGTITPAKLSGNQSGSAPAFAARAWVNYLPNSGFPTIAGSGNIASIAYTGAGRWRFIFSTAMQDANYAICCALQVAGAQNPMYCYASINEPYTASQFSIEATYGSSAFQPPSAFVSIFR
jgi:hypothetical protein